MPDETKPPKNPKATTPEAFPVVSPPPRRSRPESTKAFADLRVEVAKLTEAVATLKAESRDCRDQLQELGRDVHAYKMAARWVAAILTIVGGVIGFVADMFVRLRSH